MPSYNEARFGMHVKRMCKIETKSGIKVQTHGEELIANFLYDNNIKFLYDELKTMGYGRPKHDPRMMGTLDPTLFAGLEDPNDKYEDLSEREGVYIRPDFLIPNGKNPNVTNPNEYIVIEFFGLKDKFPTSNFDEEAIAEYNAVVEKKRDIYREEGIPFIEIISSDLPILGGVLKKELKKLGLEL